MVARADILAGRAVILINIQDTIDAQLRSIRSKMRMFTNSLSEIGGDLFRGGLAGTIAAVFPVKEFMTFQDSMLFLQTKLQATDAAMRPLEKTIRNLGMSTSFTSQEVAGAATMYAQAGFSIIEVEKALQAALDLSRGSNVDLTTSTTILSNAIRTFGVDANKAAEYASKLTTAARLGTLDIVDLGESLKYSSGTFANFGLEIESVLGMITTLANSGLKASLAGTSLNTAFLNLASSAPKLKELLGVELMEEDFKNPIQALRKLENALKRFTKIEQAGILQDLVNIRGGRAIQGLLLQGLDKVEANIIKIKHSTDEARIAAQKLDSQLGGIWRRGKSAFQEMLIAIGATTEGPLTKFGNALTKHMNTLSKLAGTNSKFVQQILLLGPASLAAGIGILGLTMIVGKLAMLLTPIMMLNNALFSIAATIVGVNMKAISSVFQEGRKWAISASKMTGPRIGGSAIASSLYGGAVSNAKKAATLAGSSFTSSFAAVVNSKMAGHVKWMFSPLMNLASVGRTVGRALTSAMLLGQGVVTPQSLMHIAKAIMMVAANSSQIGLTFREIATGASLLGSQIFTVANNMRLMSSMKIGDSFRALQKLPGTLSQASLWKVFTSRIAESFVQGVASGLIRVNALLAKSSTAKGITQLGNILFGKQFGTAINISISKQLTTAFGNIAKGGVASRVASTFKSIFGAIGSALRAATNVNWLRVFITGARGLWTAFKGVLTVLNGIRRVLFTLSGWLLIAEILFLFGDKIPVISDMLAGLGKAIRGVFSDFGRAFKAMAPSFELIRRGLSDIWKGDGERGVARLKMGFADAWNTFKAGSKLAWENFKEGVKETTDIIKNIVTGLVESFKVLGASIAAIFGVALEKGQIMIASDGTLLELVKSIFSPENIQSFFVQVVTVIGEVGKGVLGLVGFIGDILIAIKDVFSAILTGLAGLPVFGSAAREAQDAINEPTGPNAARIKELQEGIKKREDLLKSSFARWKMTDKQEAQIRARIQEGKDELAALTGTAQGTAYDPNALRAALQASIDSAIAKLSTLTDPPVPTGAAGAEESFIEAAWRAAMNERKEMLDATYKFYRDIVGRGIETATDTVQDVWGRLQAAAEAMQAKDVADAANLAPMASSIGKAVVGDFQTTRQALLQQVPKMERLAEKANDMLGDIDDGIAALNRGKDPFVFNA